MATRSVPPTGPAVPGAPSSAGLELELEALRPQITGYCYRMLGSWFEAEDAVQETMVRAWRRSSTLTERAALKSWLYRIATNVCLDALNGTKKRARPIDLGPSSTADTPVGPPLSENVWIEPAPDVRVLDSGADPADIASDRETIRLAFVTALQHLPARQRAVLVLRTVLHWSAAEVADLLETTVASVNSALQRARATLDKVQPSEDLTALGDGDRELVDRYVDCFERYDVDALVELLHEDATFQMPPLALWVRGPEQVATFMRGQGAACRGSRLVPTTANGSPAFGSYKPTADDPERFVPWSITVLEIAEDRIVGIHNFLDTRLFAEFGLPAELHGASTAELAPI
jgi:RNA polymerase sigma-70 factor, ECF subfamily